MFRFLQQASEKNVYSNEEEIVGDCEECEPSSSDNEDDDEHG